MSDACALMLWLLEHGNALLLEQPVGPAVEGTIESNYCIAVI